MEEGKGGRVAVIVTNEVGFRVPLNPTYDCRVCRGSMVHGRTVWRNASLFVDGVCKETRFDSISGFVGLTWNPFTDFGAEFVCHTVNPTYHFHNVGMMRL